MLDSSVFLNLFRLSEFEKGKDFLRGLFRLLNSRNVAVDYLRGFSIILVLVTHGFFNLSSLGLLDFLPEENYQILRSNGYLGVSIFFVVSGYLITSNIIAGNADYTIVNSIRVDLRAFYAKRVARIFPPLLVLFVLSFFLSQLPSKIFDDFDLSSPSQIYLAAAHAFTFTYNDFYFTGQGGTVAGLQHLVPLWSLSIEEVFYLIWPLALLVLKRVKIILVLLIVIILYAPAYRIEHGISSIYDYLGCFDMLAYGCLAAFISKIDFINRLFLKSRLILVSTSVGLFIVISSLDIHKDYVFAQVLVGILSGIFLVAASNLKDNKVNQSLFRKLFVPLQLFGVLSYEIYLFHLTLWRIFKGIDLQNTSAILSTPLPMLVLVLFCGSLHYGFFEPVRRFIIKKAHVL